MGYELYREVLRDAPADLTMAERFVLAVIADDANDKTRRSWLPQEVIAHRAGCTVESVQKVIQRLCRRGHEIRVLLKIGNDGRPVYSWRKRAVTYEIPRFPPRPSPERKGGRAAALDDKKGRTTDPPFGEERGDNEAGKGGQPDPPFKAERVDNASTPSPQRTSPHIPSDDDLLDAIEKMHVELYGKPCPRTHAVKVLAAIRSKARGPIGSPKFVRTVMANDERGDYRYHEGPPRFRNGEWLT
jgi:Helix-turn-helix domain